MTEIEDKRKEAIELVARYKFVENKMTAEQVAGHILNLGKEMARKEFLDEIKRRLINRICMNCDHERCVTMRRILIDIEELKQSLGVKDNER